MRAALTGGAAYVSALASIGLTQAFENPNNWVRAAIFLLFLFAFVFGFVYVARWLGEYESLEDLREKVVSGAYFGTDACVASETESVRQTASANSTYRGGAIYVPCDPLSAIQVLVQSLFELVSSHYSGTVLSDRISFEVTFMTRSYLDGGITIAAWANSEGQAPTSMLNRPGNPSRYDSTVTADLFRAENDGRVFGRILEDTSDPKVKYNAIYPNQLDRIKSSVVWPVLSDESRLLGTLVLHCDHTGFFKRSDERYWKQVLNIFSRRIALEKLRLDRSVIIAEDSGGKPFVASGSWAPF